MIHQPYQSPFHQSRRASAEGPPGSETAGSSPSSPSLSPSFSPPMPEELLVRVEGSMVRVAFLVPNTSSKVTSTLEVVSMSTKALLSSMVSPGATSVNWPSITSS